MALSRSNCAVGSSYTLFSCKILLLQPPPSRQHTCYTRQTGHACPLPLPGSERPAFRLPEPRLQAQGLHISRDSPAGHRKPRISPKVSPNRVRGHRPTARPRIRVQVGVKGNQERELAKPPLLCSSQKRTLLACGGGVRREKSDGEALAEMCLGKASLGGTRVGTLGLRKGPWSGEGQAQWLSWATARCATTPL